MGTSISFPEATFLLVMHQGRWRRVLFWMGEGATGRRNFPLTRTLYSRFLAPFVSVCFFYCEKLHNVANLFPVSPGFRPLTYSVSHPLLSHLPQTSRPFTPAFPPPCPPVSTELKRDCKVAYSTSLPPSPLLPFQSG